MTIDINKMIDKNFVCNVYSITSGTELPQLFDEIDAEGNYHFRLSKIFIRATIEEIKND